MPAAQHKVSSIGCAAQLTRQSRFIARRRDCLRRRLPQAYAFNLKGSDASCSRTCRHWVALLASGAVLGPWAAFAEQSPVDAVYNTVDQSETLRWLAAIFYAVLLVFFLYRVFSRRSESFRSEVRARLLSNTAALSWLCLLRCLRQEQVYTAADAETLALLCTNLVADLHPHIWPAKRTLVHTPN
jgi:hypothetical protein